jgi:hypothetical protein
VVPLVPAFHSIGKTAQLAIRKLVRVEQITGKLVH